MEEQLLAVTPLDGRYADRVAEMVPIVSEYGLIRYRATVEAGWVAILGTGILPDVPPLGDEEQARLQEIVSDFSIEDAKRVKEIEKTTNHDVKSVELWLRERLGNTPGFENYLELVHFGCTSEDITNLAYAMMLRDARDGVIIPGITRIRDDLAGKAEEYADIPLLARTHGQPASPTTLGKEMAVFVDRLDNNTERLGSIAILGKFSGATGNYNAVSIAYPEVDWPSVSARFVSSLGFTFNPRTTQIEPHDWIAAYVNEVALGNTVMTDIARDMWSYISNGVFKQAVVKGEVGSSTMPHKVNPIDFENAEANFGAANALLNFLAAKLPTSRLQRDLTDSSTLRTLGEALPHTIVGQKSLAKGLGKIKPDTDKIAEELNAEWSVLTEAVQTVMRRYRIEGAYEAIKAVSRGKAVDEAGYQELVEQLDLPEEAIQRLRNLTPATYVGLAPELALKKLP